MKKRKKNWYRAKSEVMYAVCVTKQDIVSHLLINLIKIRLNFIHSDCACDAVP